MNQPDSSRRPQRLRQAPKLRRVSVLSVEQISPHSLCIHFSGEDLQDFASPSFDDHIKLMLPATPESELVLPILGPNGVSFPEGAPRPLMRDYTPRRFDAQRGVLSIEFALHGDGPAASWAAQAQVGQQVAIGGPRGSTLIPVNYDWHLLVGDESALPAISRRLEELPASTRAIVIAETSDPRDQRSLNSEADLQVQWLLRDGTSQLPAAVSALQLPAGEGFAWAAGESAGIIAVREVLINQLGLAKHQVKAAAYWKLGAAGHHENLAQD
ncbi:siderophore-interacting protein [Uliginosibacterium sediminicola]|uniref:Siderophore-interacting protein n=1 Tax=Uliginosibacterium sediminicola TaxID=2024550 RepID=A0ABU9YYW1_9RHOO